MGANRRQSMFDMVLGAALASSITLAAFAANQLIT